MNISRRKLMLSATLIPLAGYAEALSLQPQTEIFAQAVRQIGGIVGLPNIMLRAVEKEFINTFGQDAKTRFIAAMDGRSVTETIANGSDEIKQQAKLIATVLYTGEITHKGVTTAPYYPWSVAWSSLAFAKAPGICGGERFGHWEHAPMGMGNK